MPLIEPVAWPGWRHLPRDTRDTLFLLGVIAWTVLPHLPHLPLWCMLLTAAVLLWRGRLALANAALPGRWVLVGVLIVAGALTWWTHGTLLGKEPGVTLAVVLMALKTLELRARRDAFVVFFLGFFLILTNFLYSQSLLVALAMVGAVWGLMTALVLAHMPVGQPGLAQAGRLAGRTALLGAPIMVLLFVLFPRVGPLWGLPLDAMSATGLSNTMRMGSVAEIALDDSVAFRLRFEGRVPPPQAMYFRGPVLGQYDGREWTPVPAGSMADVARSELVTRDAPLRYEMTMEPSRLRTLPLLEAAAEGPRIEGYRVRGSNDLQWRTHRPITERLRFTAEAHLDFRHGPREASPSLHESLALRPAASPRPAAWAEALRRQPALAEADAQTLARTVMQHIRSGGYGYTLAPGPYGELDARAAIDEFWLDRKVGFCEHFAAAFVVVMRALDVPARVVTGYQGTDPQPVDGYYIVRQSSAHAWAEYWQPGRGWTRADPTAAVAPERVERSTRLAPPPGAMAGALGAMSPALLEQLRSGWELMNNRWNQWVLNYSRGDQLDLLKDLGFTAPSWEDLTLLLVLILSALALAGALWAWWDRHRVDPWTRQMESLRTRLRSLGVPAASHEAPGQLAQRAESLLGEPARPLAAVLRELELQRYGRRAARRPDASLTRRFEVAARQLQRTR